MVCRTIRSTQYNFRYDAENHLVQVQSSVRMDTFVYDGDGNRVKGTLGGVTTAYVGNHFEWTGSTSTMKKYYYAGGQRVAMRTGTTMLNYLLSDHLGSTNVTANSSGGWQGDLLYKPWGEIRYTWGTTPTTYRYTGQREQAEIGLYYYGARWYDPSLGRWAQPDTVLAGALNVQAWDRYMYSNNNPAVYIDPSGHFSVNIFNNGGAACGVDGSFCMRSGLSKQIQLKTIAAAASVSCDTCGKSSEGYGDMGRAYDVFSQVETILGRPLTYNEVLTVTAQEEFGVLADDPTQYTRALEAEGRQFYELCGAGGICEGEELWRFLGSQQGWTGADPNEIADAINGGLDESAGETITDQAPWNPYQSDTTSWRSGSGNGNVPFKYGNYSMLPDAAQKALPIAHEGWEDYQLAVNNPLNKYVVMTMNQYYYWKDYD